MIDEDVDVLRLACTGLGVVLGGSFSKEVRICALAGLGEERDPLDFARRMILVCKQEGVITNAGFRKALDLAEKDEIALQGLARGLFLVIGAVGAVDLMPRGEN